MTRSAAKSMQSSGVGLDAVLSFVCIILLAGGLVMLTSASIAVAERATGQPFYYLQQQLVAVFIGLLGAAVALQIPTDWWERARFALPIFAIALLISVLIPGLGHEVNGSTRWLRVGGMNIVQVSEPARLLMIMYLAGYACRHHEDLGRSFGGFLRPMSFVVVTCVLQLAQPDFGATAVLLVVSLCILFVAGARIMHFIALSGVAALSLAVLAWTSPYRMARITGFLDPWADPFDSGFQLTQSLIAIGSGNIFGLGLGGSVQKLFYLPEAHTDFVFAVIAEEFGLVGSVVVIAIFAVLVWRAFGIAREAAALERFYQGYLAFGIAIWLGVQSLINIGVNMGVLPTKGLTLPMISYGRSSLVVTLIAIGLLLRIDIENRSDGRGRRRRRS